MNTIKMFQAFLAGALVGEFVLFTDISIYFRAFLLGLGVLMWYCAVHNE